MAPLLSELVDSPWLVPAVFLSLIFTVHLVPYLRDPHDLRQYPGPFFAKHSRFWLANLSRGGKRFKVIHDLHQRHGEYLVCPYLAPPADSVCSGPVVRVAPEHISIADPDVIPLTLGHQSKSLKSDFYDAWVVSLPSTFSTRSRAEHARKLKIISPAFSQKNVRELEPYVADQLRRLVGKWDGMCALAERRGQEQAWLDSLQWFSFLTFDIIGDLAFGGPFGMVEAGRDLASVEEPDGTVIVAPAVDLINGRSTFSTVMGYLPPWIRPWVKRVTPYVAPGSREAAADLLGIVRNRVNKRLKEGSGGRRDLLAMLQEGKDDAGRPMAGAELLTESLTLLTAGSDTTATSACTILWWIVKHPRVHAKVRQELDAKLPHVDGLVEYEDAKSLTYLSACINEGMRRHTTFAVGLPRILVKDTEYKGRLLRKGTVVSVPVQEIHHDEGVWGDPWTYRPERWLEPEAHKLERAFMPFSVGTFSCVGRTLAMMNLHIVLATILRRYDCVLRSPDDEELPSHEGFFRRPLASWIGIKRRSVVV